MSDFIRLPKKEDDTEGKLFVGGLSWDSTEESIRSYFEKFGTVEAVNLKKKTDDPTKHRGFCFVKFSKASESDAVLNQEDPHYIDGSKVDPKSACPAGVKPEERTKKIFVGGLRAETTEEALMEYFKEFGEITGKIYFKTDKETQKRKGFCFIEFRNEAIVDRIVKSRYHTIAGVRIETKRAIDKSKQPQNQVQGLTMTPNYGVQLGNAGGYGVQIGDAGNYAQPIIYIHPDALSTGISAASLQSLYQPYNQNTVQHGTAFNSQRRTPYPVKTRL